MKKINSEKIFKLVKKLLIQANTLMPKVAYEQIIEKYSKGNNAEQEFLNYFLINAKIAHKKCRPLCQDTGQVVVFIELGQNIHIEGDLLENTINAAVADVYSDFSFRKSVVKDSFFNRKNTQDNCPAIIYTDIYEGDEIKINILIKGGGAENMSSLLMLSPTITETEFINNVTEIVCKSGTKSCPPMFLGIGIGGTAEKALLLSKKAFFYGNKTPETTELSKKITTSINSTNKSTPFKTSVIETKIISSPTHIASLPVGITFNCHSLRHCSGLINANGEEFIFSENYTPTCSTLQNNFNFKKINSNETEKLKKLNSGDKFLLSGIVYTARDAAHQRLLNTFTTGASLPFEIKNSILFYAGPCPKTKNEIIGPIGPTTSARMDKFATFTVDLGIAAIIGKGERSEETKKIFTENKIKYFSAIGGIAAYMASCVKKCETIAYDDLGAEAIYKLEIKDLPLTCEF